MAALHAIEEEESEGEQNNNEEKPQDSPLDGDQAKPVDEEDTPSVHRLVIEVDWASRA